MSTACVEVVYVYKFLGLHIVANITFRNHTDHVVHKLSTAAFIIRKYRNFIPRHACTLLFNCLGLSHINYCAMSYYNCISKCSFQRIESKYVMCARAINNYVRFMSNSVVLASIGWPNLSDHYTKNAVNFIRSILRHDCPTHLVSCLNRVSHAHSTRFAKSGFSRFRVCTKKGSHAFAHWAPVLASSHL